jgi:hypothetical protein
MRENTTPTGANALVIAAMSKEEIMAALVKSYTDAKPINDSLVDVALRTQALTAEIYRRSIAKQLPDVPFTRRRTVMRIECTVHPNHGLPQIAKRLAQLAEEEITIVGVDYDENTGAYSFFANPEFDIKP